MIDNRDAPLVLVADDEVYTTLMLERLFEREGYEVESVNDGVSALEHARRLIPDLILLDVQMPGMTGFEVLQGLRETPNTASIPTILITARARQPSDVAHGLKLGADDYVSKPFEPRELLARAQSKIRARQLEDALQRRTQELEALLRVSEGLNQHFATSEVLDLIPFLMLDLLPGEVAAIYQVNTEYEILASRLQHEDSDAMPLFQIDDRQAVQLVVGVDHAISWEDDKLDTGRFAHGMVAPLQHGGKFLGVLLLLSAQTEFDANHIQLFSGISRQAALALRNAQLYELQANYALHLEDMVAARTSELESAQQLLIRSEKLASIGRLAASIAHEINNPLQPIRNILDDFQEDVKRGGQIDVEAIAVLQESVERIRRIVSQLLDFAGTRTQEEGLQPIDIADVLNRVSNLNRKLFEQNNTQLFLDISALPLIQGNNDQLEQVFMNLMLNAFEATSPGGSLQVSAVHQGDAIIITFRDSGSGIPPEQLENVFDPFFSTKPQGTGLGLFVSYGIIQSHNGSITVQSKVDEGTALTIQLPIQELTIHAPTGT